MAFQIITVDYGEEDENLAVDFVTPNTDIQISDIR